MRVKNVNQVCMGVCMYTILCKLDYDEANNRIKTCNWASEYTLLALVRSLAESSRNWENLLNVMEEVKKRRSSEVEPRHTHTHTYSVSPRPKLRKLKLNKKKAAPPNSMANMKRRRNEWKYCFIVSSFFYYDSPNRNQSSSRSLHHWLKSRDSTTFNFYESHYHWIAIQAAFLYQFQEITNTQGRWKGMDEQMCYIDGIT